MNSSEINFSSVLKEINPAMVLGIIEAQVTNSSLCNPLWDEIRQITTRVRETMTFEAIKDQPQIAAARKMYSACEKDPSRYRPSAEALMRRIVKGQDLYQINTLVDMINLVSLKWGYSIGGYDASLIQGPLEAGLGQPDEIYNAIGRGLLNIENLPVLRDVRGAIGSPTSDEERTSIRRETRQLLMVIYAFAGPDGLQECMDYSIDRLQRYAGATTIYTDIRE